MVVVPRIREALREDVEEIVLDERTRTRAEHLLWLLLLLGRKGEGREPRPTERDLRHARHVGRTLSTVFAAASVSRITEAQRPPARIVVPPVVAPTPTPAGPYRTPGKVDPSAVVADTVPRAELIAATETTDALSDGAVALGRIEGLAEPIVWRWNAILDRATCAACAAMDGTLSILGRFDAGFPPLHPRCRCFVTLTTR